MNPSPDDQPTEGQLAVITVYHRLVLDMFRKLTRHPLSAIYGKGTLSTAPDALATEQNAAPAGQPPPLNLNKAVPAVKGFFPLNEPAVGSAYTNTVCSPPWSTASRLLG